MRRCVWMLGFTAALAALCHVAESSPLPQSVDPEETNRDKRKIEPKVEAKYGVKNAILGLVFNKINSFIDQKTHWIDTLDRGNIAKNKQYGIEAPKDPVQSISGIFGSVLSDKLAAIGPGITLITSKLSGGSNGGHGGSGGPAGLLGGFLGSSSGGGNGGGGIDASAGFNLGGLFGAPGAPDTGANFHAYASV